MSYETGWQWRHFMVISSSWQEGEEGSYFRFSSDCLNFSEASWKGACSS